MALHYIFIVTLMVLHSLYGGISAGNDNTAVQTSNTDVKMALIEKDMEHIKSVLNAVLKQVQTTATKQQAMESTLATEIQNLKLKDSILSTKLQLLETKQQQQANILKDTVTKQQAVESTQATQDAQIQELKSGLKDAVTKQQVAGSTQAVQIQELKNRDEKLIQGLNVQVKSMIEKDAIFSTKQQVVETQVSRIDTRLSQLEGRPQQPLASEKCSCKEELKWMNSTGAALYNDVFAKQTDFENRITRQLSQLNQSAEECGCMEEVNRLHFTGVALYNDMLTKQSTLASQISRQLGHLNQTANECSCQHNLDLLNSTLISLNYKVMNTAVAGKDCAELYKRGVKLSGVYKISPSENQGKFEVYCDMETDGGGWTVFQRRQDGSVDFFRDWNDYKTGFGNLFGDFWLGNDRLHQLTAVSNYTLRVDLEDWSGVKKYAVYTQFAIANETDKYRITFGTYSGDAGDSLSQNRGRQFTTKDQDNDGWSSANCASYRKGAWWYGACSATNLNGVYYKQETTSSSGVYWVYFSDSVKSLKMTEMKIRPAGF